MKEEIKKNKHDKLAPYWAVALFIFIGIGLATIRFDLGGFWKGYVLDMVGPAWNYILFRGLFTYKADNTWTRFFTAKKKLFIFISICLAIEVSQYFKIYEATYDSWDFLAYVSILVPLFLIDLKQEKQTKVNLKSTN